MAKFYEVKLRYQKMQENGTVKKVSEHFLADALSLTEAEAKTTEAMQPFINGEFVATSAKESKVAEIMGDKEFGKFYLAKVAFIIIDEKSAKEKKAITQILVGAEDFKGAYDALMEGFKGTMADWKIVSLAESVILDVFTHE